MRINIIEALENFKPTPEKIFPDFTEDHKSFLKTASIELKDYIHYLLKERSTIWALAHKEEIAFVETQMYAKEEDEAKGKGNIEYLLFLLKEVSKHNLHSGYECGSAIHNALENHKKFESYFQ